jgi:hypothetical protein
VVQPSPHGQEKGRRLAALRRLSPPQPSDIRGPKILHHQSRQTF